MSSRVSRRGLLFAAVAVAVALLLAGVVSYFASGNPDGLDHVTARGCTEVGGALHGSCPAQHAREHALAGSPLADYAVDGDDGFLGVAGILGVLATLLIAGGLFWLLRARSGSRGGQGRRDRS
ncbi:PDGLE domain-containing protein [Prauserella cavernicola]|uniref:PDGLE domain-containing protein n=1 Tax=Prauserella cavernicola TaxID=2800127 RepID=A0A934V871_9PSEU|nr:PDGLE domain-containing protein [Prauserella cavernicola]MBK1788409.1 PDGLE domain-containing protein [Prauserella cavernicola]